MFFFNFQTTVSDPEKCLDDDPLRCEQIRDKGACKKEDKYAIHCPASCKICGTRSVSLFNFITLNLCNAYLGVPSDLSLCWAHMSEGILSHSVFHMCIAKITLVCVSAQSGQYTFVFSSTYAVNRKHPSLRVQILETITVFPRPIILTYLSKLVTVLILNACIPNNPVQTWFELLC